MNAAVLWEKLRERSLQSEFEIHTVPQNKSVPLWYLVGVREKNLIIKKAKNHTPSVNISMDRMMLRILIWDRQRNRDAIYFSYFGWN